MAVVHTGLKQISITCVISHNLEFGQNTDI